MCPSIIVLTPTITRHGALTPPECHAFNDGTLYNTACPPIKKLTEN